MTLTARLTRRMSTRAITPAQIWGAGLDDYYAGNTAAGVQVTADEVMRAAAGACIRLLADDISSLPVDFFRKIDGVNMPMDAADWYDYPTARRWDTWPHHISQVVVSMLTDGNAFIEGIPNAVTPEHLNVLDPKRIEMKQEDGETTFVAHGESPFSSANREYTDAEMMHIPWITMPGKMRGLSVLDATKESSGLELAAREWASRFFSNGATMGGIIEVPREAGQVTREAAETLRDQFLNRHQGRRKAFALGVLTGGARWVQNTVNPEQAALQPLWRHVLEEAARLFHVPPHLLASQESGGQAYASVEHRSIEYVQHAIVPIIRRLEEAYSRLIPGADTYLKFNVSALLRGDVKTRAEAYSILLQNRIMRPAEARELEDLRPDPDLRGYLATPNNTMPDSRLVDLDRLIKAGFDPDAALAYLGLPPIARGGGLVTTPPPPTPGIDSTAQRSLASSPQYEVTEEDMVRREIHVHLPEVRVPAPVFEVTVPEMRQEAPIVNVTVPETVVNVEAPVIQVHPADVRIEPAAAPIVNVTVPDTQNVNIVGLPPLRAQVKRDKQGRISEVIDG